MMHLVVKMENVYKHIIHELFISDECETLLVKQSMSKHVFTLFLNEKRCRIPKLIGFSEVIIVPELNKQLLRYFRMSPGIFNLIYNEILHVCAENLELGGSEPVVPKNSCLFSFGTWPTRKACEKLEKVCSWCDNST